MASTLEFDISDNQTLPLIGPVTAEGFNDTQETLRVEVWCGDFKGHQPGSNQEYYEVGPGPFNTLIFEFDHLASSMNETVEGKLFQYSTSQVYATQVCYDISFVDMGGGMDIDIPWSEAAEKIGEAAVAQAPALGHSIPAKLYHGPFPIMDYPVWGAHARLLVLGRLPNGRTIIEYDRHASLSWHQSRSGKWYARWASRVLFDLPTRYPAKPLGVLLDINGKVLHMVAPM